MYACMLNGLLLMCDFPYIQEMEIIISLSMTIDYDEVLRWHVLLRWLQGVLSIVGIMGC